VGFFSRLKPYTKPVINSVIGTFVSIIQGGIFPVFGIFITKMLFALFITWDKDLLRSESDTWCLAMFMLCVGSFVTGFTQKFLFGVVGENITYAMREQLYGALLKKNIGWFDLRENAPGVLNGVLSSDVQALNGASTEGSAVVMESTFAMIVGIVIGFYYHWKISLVALGCVPFMVLGGAINTKFQTGYSDIDEDAYKDANLLAGDSILNYRTVASFGHDYLIINQYDKLVEGPVKTSIKKAQCIGFWFGFSQFVQNAVFALLYWAGAMFQMNAGVQDGERIFIATFAMMFGSFAAG
jgi:ABC-type multidrug transport system fused ATPase/permease subunit